MKRSGLLTQICLTNIQKFLSRRVSLRILSICQIQSKFWVTNGEMRSSPGASKSGAPSSQVLVVGTQSKPISCPYHPEFQHSAAGWAALRGHLWATGLQAALEELERGTATQQGCLQGGTCSLLALGGILPITPYQNSPPLPRFLKFPHFFHRVVSVILCSYKGSSGRAVSCFPLGKGSDRSLAPLPPLWDAQCGRRKLKAGGNWKGTFPKLKPAQNLTSVTIIIHNQPFPQTLSLVVLKSKFVFLDAKQARFSAG